MLYGLLLQIQEQIEFIPFILMILFILPLVSITIGRKHYLKQYGTDAMINLERNPYMYKILPNSKEELSFTIQI